VKAIKKLASLPFPLSPLCSPIPGERETGDEQREKWTSRERREGMKEGGMSRVEQREREREMMMS